jgi:hypothetical protein
MSRIGLPTILPSKPTHFLQSKSCTSVNPEWRLIKAYNFLAESLTTTWVWRHLEDNPARKLLHGFELSAKKSVIADGLLHTKKLFRGYLSCFYFIFVPALANCAPADAGSGALPTKLKRQMPWSVASAKVLTSGEPGAFTTNAMAQTNQVKRAIYGTFPTKGPGRNNLLLLVTAARGVYQQSAGGLECCGLRQNRWAPRRRLSRGQPN